MLLSIVIVSTIADVVVGLPMSEQTLRDESKSSSMAGAAYNLITRSQWQARSPKEISPLAVPVPYVVIHHSYTPPACYDHDQCCYAMRTMQSMHVDGNKWWDIGYNFGIGSDGSVYEGRGWNILGAHALRFNTVSIGICLIGNWNDTLPPKSQLDAVKALIADGVAQGFIKDDYKLVGHRQVRPTECPGQTLFDHITTWPHYDPTLDLAKGYHESNVIPNSSKN